MYASTRSLKVVLLLRFPRTAAPSLARRLSTEAERLGAELVDVSALREREQAELYERLGGCELRADVTDGAEAALTALAERLGASGGRAPVLTYQATDPAGLIRLYLRNATLGLDAAGFGLVDAGPVRVRLASPGAPPLELGGSADDEDGQLRVRATPDAALERVVVLEASRLRAGRQSMEGAQRRVCHLLARRPGIESEPVLALGSGGLLLLPSRPIPEGAELRLSVESATDDSTQPRLRLRVRAEGEQPLGTLKAQPLELLEAEEPERFNVALERLAGRPPRLLALLGDAPLRHALAERLRGSGIELAMPAVDEVRAALEDGLLRADAVLLDLDLKETGYALPARLDTFARAAELRLVALGQWPDPGLRSLSPVADVVRKGEPLARLLRGIDRALGR